MTNKNKLLVAAALVIAISGSIGALYAVYQYVYLDRVSGKVIIVQKDAHANKLALVKVVAVRKADALMWRDAVLRDCYTVLNERKKHALECKEALEGLDARNDKLISQRESYLARTTEMVELARRVWLVNSADAASKRQFFLLASEVESAELRGVESLAQASEWQLAYSALKRDIMPAAERALVEARKRKEDDKAELLRVFKEEDAQFGARLARLLSPEHLSIIPANVSVVASDRTDDSGEFVLRVPRGDYFIFANAERSVFSDVERYYWAQPVSAPSQESSKCLLGNMNLVEASDDDLWQGLYQQLSNYSIEK